MVSNVQALDTLTIVSRTESWLMTRKIHKCPEMSVRVQYSELWVVHWDWSVPSRVCDTFLVITTIVPVQSASSKLP